MITYLRARRVPELGSGLSTLVIGQACRRAGEGDILSFDDDGRWAAHTVEAIERERLESFAEFQVPPLTDIVSGSRESPWYGLSSLDNEASFEITSVDGPPALKNDRLATLLALYEFRRHLSDDGVLVLNDAMRSGKVEIANQWECDFSKQYFRNVRIDRGLFLVSLQQSNLDILPI